LQAPVKKVSLEGASTYNVKLGGHDVLDKKTKVKFSTIIHHKEGFHLISIFFPSQHWIHNEIESAIFDDHHIELDQFHNFKSLIDKLTSSHFYEIELNEKCDLDSQFCDPVQIPESILTPVLLLDLSNILESVLILTPVILELESPILSHIPF